jgi:hypothetical protein
MYGPIEHPMKGSPFYQPRIPHFGNLGSGPRKRVVTESGGYRRSPRNTQFQNWSGRGESNSFHEFPKLGCYQYTTPRYLARSWRSLPIIPCETLARRIYPSPADEIVLGFSRYWILGLVGHPISFPQNTQFVAIRSDPSSP